MDKQLREILDKMLDKYYEYDSKWGEDNDGNTYGGYHLDETGLLDELESYINDNYVSKDKVRGLKARQIGGFYKDPLGQWFKRYPTCGFMVTDELLLNALNVVDEINTAIDTLVSVPTPESEKV